MKNSTLSSGSFLHQVDQTMSDFDMIGPKDAVLLGVSGGPDSMALALCLLEMKDKLNITLGIAHLHHGLRANSADRDQAFIKDFASRHHLSFHTRKVDTKAYAKQSRRSLEDAGRELRFKFFSEISQAHGYTKIALGHHRDDNAEQILMNLIRGAGIQGLSGIRPKRNAPDMKQEVIRPLIQCSKSDILSFLSSRQQTFMLDETNEDPLFLRNKIRHELIPMLENEYNPEIRRTLNRIGDLFLQENSWIHSQTAELFDTLAGLEQTGEIVSFSLDAFNRLHPAIKRRIARMAIHQIKQDLKRITMGHVDDIIRLAETGLLGKSLDLPDQVRVFIKDHRICFKKEAVPLRELKRN